MKDVTNMSNSIGWARELLTTGATTLEGAMKAANNRSNGTGGVREAVTNRSNIIGGAREAVTNRINNSGGREKQSWRGQ